LKKSVFVVGARRTPFGAFGGALKALSATDLGVEAATATLLAAGADPAKVDSVVFGNVAQTSADAIYQARHIGLRAGCRQDIPALTVNRLCGSGFEAVAQGAREIETAASCGIVLAGGTESMSQAPHITRNLRWGTRLGANPELEDSLWTGLTDSLCGLPMGITAENLAEEYGISRDDADAFGIRSQKKWKEAHDAGIFDAEVAPVVIKGRRKDVVFEVDEHPKPDSDAESMARLPSSFKKEGTVTAANASGICDGAAAVLIASEEAATAEGLTPMVRVVGFSVVGVDPSKMGIGPVPAIQALVSAAGITLDDVELLEVNEAFAPQCLAVQKALGIDDERLNPHGGAIALGHPLGASGARIIGHIAHNTSLFSRFAIGSACIGGGQGIAVLFEKM
jgi:acetyl-CoA acyltransferase 2